MSELDSNDKILLQRAYASLGEANAIMRFLSEHFRDKYGLTPDNQITPDGQIVSVSGLPRERETNGTLLHSGSDTESESTYDNTPVRGL